MQCLCSDNETQQKINAPAVNKRLTSLARGGHPDTRMKYAFSDMSVTFSGNTAVSNVFGQ